MRRRSAVASSALNAIIGLGLLTMLASLPVSAEDGPMPADRVARRKQLAKLVLFTGGGVAAMAAAGRYAIDRTRPDPPTEETRR